MKKSKTIRQPSKTESLFMKGVCRMLLLFFVCFLVGGCTFRSSRLRSSESLNKDDSFSLSGDSESDSFGLPSSPDEQSESPASSPLYLDPFYMPQIQSKMAILTDLKSQSDEYEVFTFYTDHHCFTANGTFDVNLGLLEHHFEFIKYIQDLSGSEFVLFGGDMLNDSDTKTQACYKLSLYAGLMNRFFENPFIIVGNHDTNYKGDTFVNSNNYESCTLSQETINDVLFNGGNSYYSFDTQNTSFYCFDSGIDWMARNITDYQYEQLDWFAESLLNDNKDHKAVFIHMAMIRFDGVNRTMIPMLSEIGRIAEAFNERGTVVINDNSYDFSSSQGFIEFSQSGHSHRDLNSFLCEDVPAIITASFCPSETVTRPTFDVVFADYTNHGLHLLRIGDGDDRYFDI